MPRNSLNLAVQWSYATIGVYLLTVRTRMGYVCVVAAAYPCIVHHESTYINVYLVYPCPQWRNVRRQILAVRLRIKC